MAQLRTPTVASIAEADEFVINHSVALQHNAVVNLNPFEIRLWDQSLPYRRLLLLKSLYRHHAAVDQRFDERRDIHLRALDLNTVPSRVHLVAFWRAFAFLDHANANCFGSGHVRRFLDLGCAPGGFSQWLLQHNRDVYGVGVTLPVEEAGIPLQIDSAFLANFRVCYDDLIRLATASMESGVPVQIHLPDDHHEPYDLVIAGAYLVLQRQKPWWQRMQMVLSQTLIIISNIAADGTAVVSISTKLFLWIVDLIGMLRQCFKTVTAHKTGRLHAVRTSCYLICRGFRATPEEVEWFTARLHSALRYLVVVSAEWYIDEDGIWHCDRKSEDLPLLSGESADTVFDTQHRFVLELFEPLWNMQYDAIRVDFAKILIEEHGESAGIPNQSPDDDGNGAAAIVTQADVDWLATASNAPFRFREWHHRSRPLHPISSTIDRSTSQSASQTSTSWRSRERSQTFSQATSGTSLPENLFGPRRRSNPADSDSWRRAS